RDRGHRASASLGHFFLQHFGEAVETVLRRYLAEDRLLDEWHAIGVDLAAPAGVGQIRADDADRERLHESVQQRIVGEFRLGDDGLARRQQAEGLAIHEARLVIQQESQELPRALLVAATLERRERLGEIERRALLRRTDGQRQGREFVGPDVLLLLGARAR